jgi:hypothetical protein
MGEVMSEQRIGDNYLQALLENHDVGINPSHITVGNLLRDLVDARAELTGLERSFSLVNGLYHQLLKDAAKDRAEAARLSAELEGAIPVVKAALEYHKAVYDRTGKHDLTDAEDKVLAAVDNYLPALTDIAEEG